MSEPLKEKPQQKVRVSRSDDLVPDRDSEAYRVVRDALRTGKKVSTRGMTREQIRAAMLGQNKAK
jgi:hypothetical protein